MNRCRRTGAGKHIALVWWLAGDAQLSMRARRAIEDESNEIFVSAASAWEVATKHRLGKLPSAGPLAVDFAREVRAQGFTPLAISLEHGQVAGSLVTDNRDPFDRMLVAQAREEKLALVSMEERFEELGVVRVW